MQYDQAKAIVVVSSGARSLDAFCQAIELYQRGIDLDNLSEEIYQRLISCLKKRGEDAGALNVYRCCRDMLSIVLGVAPSKEAQAMVAQQS